MHLAQPPHSAALCLPSGSTAAWIIWRDAPASAAALTALLLSHYGQTLSSVRLCTHKALRGPPTSAPGTYIATCAMLRIPAGGPWSAPAVARRSTANAALAATLNPPANPTPLNVPIADSWLWLIALVVKIWPARKAFIKVKPFGFCLKNLPRLNCQHAEIFKSKTLTKPGPRSCLDDYDGYHPRTLLSCDR